MSGDSDRNKKIIPLDPGRDQQVKNTLDDLVRHMRVIRDSIPVNKKLRGELRARLIEGRGVPADEVSPGPPSPEKELPRTGRGALAWMAGALAVLCVILAAAFFNLGDTGVKMLSTGPVVEMARFWTEDGPLSPAVSPSGEIIVADRGGALLLLNRQGSRFAAVRPPAGQKYMNPAWSPDGKKLALVLESSEGHRIIQVDMPSGAGPGDPQREIQLGLEGAAVIAQRPPGSYYKDLCWSPDGTILALTLVEPNGQSRVMLAAGGSEIILGQGSRPAWSPDGNWLVVERGGAGDKSLWLIQKEGGQSYPLGPGRLPVWNKNGILIFVKTGTRDKILSYLPDGSPQFTVSRKTGEIRWLRLGSGEGLEKRIPAQGDLTSGARLLLTPDSSSGSDELQWMRSLELGGVREPRTLFLDRAGEIQGLVSGGDQSSLLMSRGDGSTVVLTRIVLVEKSAEGEVGLN